LTTANDAQQQ